MRPFIFGLTLVLVGALALWRPARVAVQTLLLLPALFPSPPIDPLALLTPEQVQEQQASTYCGRDA